jgi:hypothetical protein
MARAVEGEEPGNARLRGAQKRGKEELSSKFPDDPDDFPYNPLGVMMMIARAKGGLEKIVRVVRNGDV